MIEFRVGYVIVFRTEGLNLDNVLDDLKKCGCVIAGVSEDYCTVDDETCTSIFINSDYATLSKLKIRYILLEDKSNAWHFWPMESYSEKMKALRETI